MLLRPYTPVTAVQQPGFVDFVIKVSTLCDTLVAAYPIVGAECMAGTSRSGWSARQLQPWTKCARQ
jgi:hypothetical protein